jgi:hypothetical protein
LAARVAGTDVGVNTLHGHVDGAAAVVNVHEYGAMVCPVAFVAPLTVTPYVVLNARALEGVNVAVLVAES